MFRIKICGITNLADARAACAAGADALGFNFFSKSRRFIEPQLAGQIEKSIPAEVAKIGVFVNHSPQEIADIISIAGLDCVQLHGHEPPEIIAQLPDALIIRAWPATAAKFHELASYLQQCQAAGRVPDAILFDTPSATEFGGTGRTANWDEIVAHRHMFNDYPLILAGGLTPDNVAEAVAAVHPQGVDVASGVETFPGQKNAALMRQFIFEAQAALHANKSIE